MEIDFGDLGNFTNDITPHRMVEPISRFVERQVSLMSHYGQQSNQES